MTTAVQEPHETSPVTVTVDGQARTAAVPPRRLLVHLLREDLGVTGPHVGCDTSQCGACTVVLDGVAVKSCTVLAVQADGGEVETAASLGGDHPLQQAFHARHALQCGFCTPGMLMSCRALLEEHPSPSEAQVRSWLKGNLCRCTGYQHIVDAVLEAADG
ncbi:(2Fe-2S)-binding protein [Euzebya tangerina]|uniref:(2Fe-2S)-binding protein n=1 Tax=Euzebya tangerina TaxID=591198 RepID=UPI000E30C338|nr:(2Fe-2S)-binding protein [Euzebya tangerina]